MVDNKGRFASAISRRAARPSIKSGSVETDPSLLLCNSLSFLPLSQASDGADQTFVFADVDGDGLADLQIMLQTPVTLTAADFVL